QNVVHCIEIKDYLGTAVVRNLFTEVGDLLSIPCSDGDLLLKKMLTPFPGSSETSSVGSGMNLEQKLHHHTALIYVF
uniref:Uncharacterized protein n=1 Tax=Junco hyemalis TaxID=40217 RepID=A0A8C5JFU6_JUNHY